MKLPFSKISNQDIEDRQPTTLQEHVVKAYELLGLANRLGIQIPSDVVTSITSARLALTSRSEFTGNVVLETRFWNAYGLLASIKPAETARRLYNRIFVLAFFILLVAQLYYSTGAFVRDKLVQIESDISRRVNQQQQLFANQPPNGDRPPAPSFASQQNIEMINIITNISTSQAYYALGRRLIGHFGAMPQLPPLPDPSGPAPVAKIDFNEALKYQIVFQGDRGRLDIYLLFLSQYLLPILYGLLGGCAYVLRQLTEPIGRLTYAHEARVRYTLRLFIGPLSGLAAGWFFNGAGTPNVGGSGLSPFALAFAAGYGSHLLFAALDKVLNAFVPPAALSTKTETTTGGVTTTIETQQETRVAGPPRPLSATGLEEQEVHDRTPIGLAPVPRPVAVP